MHNVLLIEDNPGDARLILEMIREDPEAPFQLHTADRLSGGLEPRAAVLGNPRVGWQAILRHVAEDDVGVGLPFILERDDGDEAEVVEACLESDQLRADCAPECPRVLERWMGVAALRYRLGFHVHTPVAPEHGRDQALV